MHLVGQVDGRSGCVGSGAGDRTNVGAGRIVSVGHAGSEIGSTGRIVPVGTIVTLYPKVRSDNYFQIIRQAGVSDGEEVCGRIASLGELVDEGSIRVVENLAVAVVLHHDQEDMVESWDTCSTLNIVTIPGERHAR